MTSISTISASEHGEDFRHRVSSPGLPVPLSYPAIIAVWAAVIITLSVQSVFMPVDGMPPPAMPIAIMLPPLLFLLAYRTMPSVRNWVASLNLAAVTAFQGWRILGGVFLFLAYYGDLPDLFAWPAGLGDVMIGLVAPWVTAAVILKSTGWRKKLMALIAFGMLDFIVAVGSGILTVSGGPLAFAGQPGSELVNAFPLVLVPALFVPMFIILHLIAWIKLRTEI